MPLDDNQNVSVSCREKCNSHSTLYTLGRPRPWSFGFLYKGKPRGRSQDKQAVLGALPVVPAEPPTHHIGSQRVLAEGSQ